MIERTQQRGDLERVSTDGEIEWLRSHEPDSTRDVRTRLLPRELETIDPHPGWRVRDVAGQGEAFGVADCQPWGGDISIDGGRLDSPANTGVHGHGPGDRSRE